MRPVVIGLCLFKLSATAWASTPLELTITDLLLPKVKLSVKNTDDNRIMKLWRRGNSWGDPTISFIFRDAAGKVVEEIRSAPKRYTRNFAAALELRPAGTQTYEFDLSDQSEWNRPVSVNYRRMKGMTVRAVLRQSLDEHAHMQSVFTGVVSSAWTGGKAKNADALCEEWSCLPRTSTRPSCKGADFVKHIPSLRIPQNDTRATLMDFLGTLSPWDQVGLITPMWAADQSSALVLLFPDHTTVTLMWDVKRSLSASERKRLNTALDLRRFGDALVDQPHWGVASEVLPKLPARGLVLIGSDGGLRFKKHWHLQRNGSYLEKE
jgi:hypothetical protein